MFKLGAVCVWWDFCGPVSSAQVHSKTWKSMFFPTHLSPDHSWIQHVISYRKTVRKLPQISCHTEESSDDDNIMQNFIQSIPHISHFLAFIPLLLVFRHFSLFWIFQAVTFTFFSIFLTIFPALKQRAKRMVWNRVEKEEKRKKCKKWTTQSRRHDD